MSRQGSDFDPLTAFPSSASSEPGRRSLADHRRGPESGPLPGAAGPGSTDTRRG